METTKLYVEYIVVGMETLAIIFLVIFIIIGNAFLPIIKYCIKNIVPSIIMLGWCYILGLIVDRIADIIYDKRKMHIKEKYPIEAETSIIVWEHFKQDAFATFTLSRIRLMRSTALNSFAMLIVVYLRSYKVSLWVENNDVDCCWLFDNGNCIRFSPFQSSK